MTKTEVGEEAVAELLEDVLQARRDYAALGDERPLPGEYEGPRQMECSAREDAAEERLLALDLADPATALAALVCSATVGDGPIADCDGGLLDFEAARDEHVAGPIGDVVVGLIMTLERRCAGGPVAEAIARHRDLASRDAEFRSECRALLAPFEEAADASEGKRARELRNACEKIYTVMVESRRLSEQLGETPTAPA